MGEIPWLVTAEHGVGDGKQSVHVDANGKRDITDLANWTRIIRNGPFSAS